MVPLGRGTGPEEASGVDDLGAQKPEQRRIVRVRRATKELAREYRTSGHTANDRGP